jgi:hypothetical protein
MRKRIQKIEELMGAKMEEKKKSEKNKEDNFLLALIELLCEVEAHTKVANSVGVNLYELEEKYIVIIKSLLEKVYGEEITEIILWWVFESIAPDGEVMSLRMEGEEKEHKIKTPQQLLKFIKKYNGN